jgi:hypothetical protein
VGVAVGVGIVVVDSVGVGIVVVVVVAVGIVDGNAVVVVVVVADDIAVVAGDIEDVVVDIDAEAEVAGCYNRRSYYKTFFFFQVFFRNKDEN